MQADNRTRGLSNRGVGRAVFTTMNPEEAAYGSYGDHVFEIDMAQLPYHPYVGQEPAVVAYDLRGGLAHLLGADDYVPNEEGDMSPDTVIVYGNIPPQCLKLID